MTEVGTVSVAQSHPAELARIVHAMLAFRRYMEINHELLAEWHVADVAAEEAKKRELELRKKVFSAMWTRDVESGQQTIEIGEGWKVKLEKKQHYNCDQKLTASIIEMFPGVFKTKYEVSVSGYKKLSSYSAVLGDAITIADGTPSVELIAPKS